MQLIDTHCHLAHGRLLADVQAVLARGRTAGLAAFICAAADIAESRAALGLAHREKDVFCTAGVHPHEAKSCGQSEGEDEGKMPSPHPAGETPAIHEGGTPSPHYLRQIEQLCADGRNVAIGEIGLDYHYDFSPRPDQRRVFAEQLDLARRLGKPVVVHTREAFDDTLAIIAESGLDGRRIVFHSFTETPGRARLALDLGATLSFSGIVTFAKSTDLQQAAALVPADRLLVETDAPYLSPEPVRKLRTNEPANVLHVANFLARLRNISPQELAQQTTANALRFFALPPLP
jgi:TatD DNase family protein